MAVDRNRIVGDSIYKLALANFAKQRSQAKALSENQINQLRQNYDMAKREFSEDKKIDNLQDL